MNFEEWKKTIFYTKNHIVCPIPKRITISKLSFVESKGYNLKKEHEFLKKYYNENIKDDKQFI